MIELKVSKHIFCVRCAIVLIELNSNLGTNVRRPMCICLVCLFDTESLV